MHAPPAFTGCPPSAEIVAETLHQLRSNRGHDTRSLVRALSAALDVPVALVDGGGRCIAGDESVSSLLGRVDLASELAGPARAVQLKPGGEILLQPVVLSSTGRTHAWLAAVRSGDSALGTEAGLLALSVASWAFIAHLANRSLGAERESRQRLALLADLLRQAEAPSRDILERASVLGWRLSGWHVGVEVDLSSGWAADERIDSAGVIEAALSRQDLSIELIDRPTSGWVGWFNYEMPPTIAETQQLTHRIRLALLDAERTFGGVRLCAGVGSVGEGLTGLVTTLSDAHEASLLARGQEIGGAVEHFDVLGLRRVLADWLASDVRRSVARQLLEPLISVDPSGALVRTLRCFLDEESSATATAAILGVHRNTVLDRLERIRKLLPVDLNAPDDRLVVHLATRLITADGVGIG